MSVIVPTVTAENPHTYRDQIERIAGFIERIHIDLADGELAPTKLINPIQAWWPDVLAADIHLMYQRPEDHIETLISLQPNLVIFHAEADGNILGLLRELRGVSIKAGVALLESTVPENYANEISEADHVLVFGGKLGYHGGVAKLDNLDKVKRIRQIKDDIEVSWDGGVTDENVNQIAEVGVDVINVGGFIQKADAPQDAYDILVEKLKQ